MAFRFNYTNRKKILTSDIEVRVLKDVSPLKIFLHLNLANYRDFIPTDIVVIEALCRTKSERIDLGTLGNLNQEKTAIEFPEFPDGLDVHYRFKIIDAKTRKIKGLAEEIHNADRPPQLADLEPLFPIAFSQPEDDLKERFWKVSFSEPKNPVLVISKAKFQSRDCVKSNEFKAFVWPQALRDVLVHAFIVGVGGNISWQEKWKAYAVERLGANNPPAAKEFDEDPVSYLETIETWIDEVVALFSSYFGLGAVTIKNLTKEIHQ
jgi:hypothetical protein